MSFISKKAKIKDIYIANYTHARSQGKAEATWYLNRRFSGNTRDVAEVASKSL